MRYKLIKLFYSLLHLQNCIHMIPYRQSIHKLHQIGILAYTYLRQILLPLDALLYQLIKMHKQLIRLWGQQKLSFNILQNKYSQYHQLFYIQDFIQCVGRFRNKFYHYSKIKSKVMRQQALKRIHNQPMKSPSPDIANKNVIKNTKVQIKDVHRYFDQKSSKQSKSPRINNSLNISHGNALQQLEHLRQKVRELEHRIQQLTSENQSYISLVDINSRLNGQLAQMRQALKVQSKRDLSPRGTPSEGNSLQEYRQKILQLVEQNKRLAKKLNEKDAVCQQIEKQNERQRNQIMNLRISQPQYPITHQPYQPYQPNQQTQSPSKDNKGVEMIRSFYEDKFEPELKKSQIIWASKIRELQDRLTVIKNLQFSMEQRINEVNRKEKQSLITPTKPADDSRRTYHRNDRSDSDHNKPLSSFVNDSPFLNKGKEEERLQTENQKLSEHINYLQVELDKSRKKCLELEQDLFKANLNAQTQSQSLATQQPSNDSFYKSKIQYLESQLQNKIKHIIGLQKKLAYEKEDLENTKQRLQRSNYLLQNEMNNYKTALNQEKQRSIMYQNSLSQMTEKCRNLEQNAVDPQENIRYKERLQAYYENELQRTKKYYEELLKDKDQQIGKELHNYLEALRNIKRGIEETNIEGIIQENQQMVSEKFTIENQLALIKDENERLITDLRRKMILQQQRIIQLEKDNQLLSNEISQLNKQKEKLKKAMIEFEEVKVPQYENRYTPKSEITEKKTRYNCKLKGCLKETIEKIDNLEVKITRILKE